MFWFVLRAVNSKQIVRQCKDLLDNADIKKKFTETRRIVILVSVSTVQEKKRMNSRKNKFIKSISIDGVLKSFVQIFENLNFIFNADLVESFCSNRFRTSDLPLEF